MDIEKKLQEEIRYEREMKQSRSITDMIRLLDGGNIREVNTCLLYHLAQSDFYTTFKDLLNHVKKTFNRLPADQKEISLSFLLDLSINLSSCTVYWHLLSKDSPLRKEEVTGYCEEALVLLDELEKQDAGITGLLLNEITKQEDARLKAEEFPDEERMKLVHTAVGRGLAGYVRYLTKEITESNVTRLFMMRMKGETKTKVGHDYASFLKYSLWRGASFVTTNPVLVKLAWDIEDERYSQITDDILKQKGNNIPEVASQLTMSVVYSNAALLRDIFLITGGKEGYVCLQVNPENHYDSDRMVEEANVLYGKLREEFKGVPNVVFKLPGTKAGINAARRLTSSGIGVTMTVTFSYFQLIPAAKVICDGHALVSYLAVMNGRLANPVMKELESTGNESVVSAGRYAGVVVGKRIEKILRQMDIPEDKVRVVIASLRNYGGEIPDVTELVGTGIITFFPNIRRAFDLKPRHLNGNQVEIPIPEETMNNLMRSEIFKQAYYMEGDKIRPSKILNLSMEKEVVEWAPVNATLTQFKDFYYQLCKRISARAEKFELIDHAK